jgi:hypothetical protein
VGGARVFFAGGGAPGEVEVTNCTIQGRLLLRPSPELTDIILGIIGKAQALYGMTLHAFVFLSTHAHFLLSPTSAAQVAQFMQFVNANVAKEAGRLHAWRDRLWSRRYRAIVVADDIAAMGRLRYILAHGAKEGLLASRPRGEVPEFSFRVGRCQSFLFDGKQLLHGARRYIGMPRPTEAGCHEPTIGD